MKRSIYLTCLAAITTLTMANSGCNDANVASENLSQEADNFRVVRRIIFYNGFTNDYMLEIKGRCSLQPTTTTRGIAAVCKVGDGYKKHILGLSDNVTYFVEQLEGRNVSPNFYQVSFKPTVIIPDIRLELGTP